MVGYLYDTKEKFITLKKYFNCDLEDRNWNEYTSKTILLPYERNGTGQYCSVTWAKAHKNYQILSYPLEIGDDYILTY